MDLAVDLAEFAWIGEPKRSVSMRRTQEFEESLLHFPGILSCANGSVQAKAGYSVFWDARIDLVRPGRDPALQVVELPETGFLQDP